MTPAPDRYGVIGYPIAHSRSPEIHRLFAEQTGQSLVYERLEAAPAAFESAVRGFAADGGRGLNVTLPHKEAAAALADTLSERAAEAGAVNTLALRDGEIFGDNTDGVGLLRDLTGNLGVALADAEVLVLGAGGAARGILAPLLRAGPSRVVIANRTPARAEALARRFGALGPVEGCGFAAVPPASWRLAINATSAAFGGDLPAWPPAAISAGTLCYDLSYRAGTTPFCTWAEAQGAARCVMGLGMLVEQAAESFFIWRGVRPETAPVVAALGAGTA